jgi:hypothetical protein
MAMEKVTGGFLRLPGDVGRMLVEIAARRGTSMGAELDPLLRPAVAEAGAAEPLTMPEEKGGGKLALVKVAGDLARHLRMLKVDRRIKSISGFAGAAVRAAVTETHREIAAEMSQQHRKSRRKAKSV